MAFVFARLPAVQLTAEIKAAVSPSETVVQAQDPRAVSLLRFLPWHQARLGAGQPWIFVIGEDHFAGFFYDLLGLPENLLPAAPAVPWPLLKVHPREFTKLLMAAEAARMPMLEYQDRCLALKALERALGTLDEWPAADAASLEFGPPVDFNQAHMLPLTCRLCLS